MLPRPVVSKQHGTINDIEVSGELIAVRSKDGVLRHWGMLSLSQEGRSAFASLMEAGKPLIFTGLASDRGRRVTVTIPVAASLVSDQEGDGRLTVESLGAPLP